MNTGQVAKNILLDKTCDTCMNADPYSIIADYVKCTSAPRATKEFDLKTNSTKWRDFRLEGLKCPEYRTCNYWYYRGYV